MVKLLGAPCNTGQTDASAWVPPTKKIMVTIMKIHANKRMRTTALKLKVVFHNSTWNELMVIVRLTVSSRSSHR